MSQFLKHEHFGVKSRPMFVEQNKTKTLCLWTYKKGQESSTQMTMKE